MVDDIAETDNRIVVPAKEILEKIEKKESVEYHNITIDGDLDLSKLSLQTKPIKRTSYDSGVLNLPKENKVVVSSIKINFSKIMGIINFKGVSFQNGVDFKATNFIKYANLCGVQFEESANFSQAVFCETADFEI